MIYSALDAEYLAMFDNLTAVQKRCTELLEEARAARRERDDALITATLAARALRVAASELVRLRAEIAFEQMARDPEGEA